MTSSNLETADVATTDTGTAAGTDPDAAPADAFRKPRASRRIPKSDAVLEAAVERARSGLLEVAPEAQIGRHISATIEGERLVTHRFEAFLPGYGGWQWYASVARVARSKDVTVCEVGLLPSAASLIAPEWLPWSERVRPEDSQTDETAPPAVPAEAGTASPDTETVGGEARVDDAPGDDPATASPVAEAGDAATDEIAGDAPTDEIAGDAPTDRIAGDAPEDAVGRPDAG